MKKIVVLMATLISILSLNAQEIALVPMPNSVIVGHGSYKVGESISIAFNVDSVAFEATYLSDFLSKNGKKTTINSKRSLSDVRLTIVPKKYAKEEYKLLVDKQGVEIISSTKEGLFRGISTLSQIFLQNLNELPFVEIADLPRFEYRSLMLDAARNFIPVADIKRYIDQMCRFKYNYLHLHLSDDQGWRVEIKKYPFLTQIGSKRSETDGDGVPHSGFYTQNQLRELVAYARQKHVEIIPEIDVPGHSVAAIAAYPALTCRDTVLTVRTTAGVSRDLLCAGNEKVFEMHTDIFKELFEIFPSKYFHMGGDEAPLDNWETCPKCELLKRQKGFKTSQDLLGYFMERLGKVVNDNRKTPLFWYELDVPTYPENSITFAWRMGLSESVIERSRELGYKVICAPGEHAYFDYPHKRGDHPVINWGMPVLSLEQVYKFDPGYGLSPEKQAHIMGVEATLWSECIKDINRTFYMTYPRALALAECGWSNMEVRNWESFVERIKPVVLNMIGEGINIRVPYEEFAK